MRCATTGPSTQPGARRRSRRAARRTYRGGVHHTWSTPPRGVCAFRTTPTRVSAKPAIIYCPPAVAARHVQKGLSVHRVLCWGRTNSCAEIVVVTVQLYKNESKCFNFTDSILTWMTDQRRTPGCISDRSTLGFRASTQANVRTT